MPSAVGDFAYCALLGEGVGERKFTFLMSEKNNNVSNDVEWPQWRWRYSDTLNVFLYKCAA